MSPRPAQTHADEHAIVARDVDAYRSMRVRWHLRKSHGWRHFVGPPVPLDELEAIHARYHEEAT